MLRLTDVVNAWRTADPKHIHPTREHVSEKAYWDSGKPQAELVLDLVGVGAWVLDFGCGDGRIAIPMAKLGLIVTAVDAAPEMIERLQHQAQVQEGNGAGIQTHVWDGFLPLPVGVGYPYDAINARAVFIHHSHTDVTRMVSNLAPLLATGGFLIADWPIGEHHERRDWIDVTTWEPIHRNNVAAICGLSLVSEGVPTVRPSVWVKQ